MKVFLHEIKEQETELDFTEAEPWLLEAITSLDEHLDDPNSGLRPKGTQSSKSAGTLGPRTAKAHFELKRLDEIFVITGELETDVRLCCSRCLKPFLLPANSHFSCLYSRDPVMAGHAHLGRDPEGRSDEIRPQGQNQGHARHAHDFEGDLDPIASRDVEVQYVTGDSVNLADILREQMQLRIPFQPLCREDCKGMCVNCGTDLNQGRCACSKLGVHPAFATLKNFPARKS